MEQASRQSQLKQTPAGSARLVAALVSSIALSESQAGEIDWAAQAAEDAKHDVVTTIFEGKTPNKMVCGTTLRAMPDGSWVMVMMGGGDLEPLPANRVFLTRSTDFGKTWLPMEQLDFETPAGAGKTVCNTDLMMHKKRATLFVSTHDGAFGNWQQWMTHSDDSCRTWSRLEPAPGKTHHHTFTWSHILTRDGRLMLPFQHYLLTETIPHELADGRKIKYPRNPRNGVMISADDGKTWTLHGDIRTSADDGNHSWAENNIVELADGSIAMIIRNDRTGALYSAVSKDGGRTWPAMATRTSIPNPGSKVTIYSLGGNAVAMLHNPNSAALSPQFRGRQLREPLSLWVSFDGMKTWPYQRVLVKHSADGPGGGLSYPDGFVSEDRQYLHFAFDDARHRAVYVGAKLPKVPATTEPPSPKN